jgi:hypothetical protein
VTTPQAFDYSVFGLHVRSDLPLPELLAAPPGGQPEVIIRLGEVPPAADPGPGLQATDHGAVLTIDGIARYAIADGASIIVDPGAGASDANVRLYLLGSAMGILLHQRGLLPLHANAVEIGGKAFAFMGASGSGKSTMAAWLHDRGYPIIADDVCVVGFADDGRPQVHRGIARLRLWRDVLDVTGRDPASYARSFAGQGAPEKYDVPLTQLGPTDAPVALAAAYLLERSETLRIERLTGIDAAEAVFANTYRGAYVASAGNSRDHWSACARLVSGTPIFRAGRQWGLDDLDEQYCGLLEHAERQLGS